MKDHQESNGSFAQFVINIILYVAIFLIGYIVLDQLEIGSLPNLGRATLASAGLCTMLLAVTVKESLFRIGKVTVILAVSALIFISVTPALAEELLIVGEYIK